MPTNLIAVESVAQRILLIRGQKVILDADLAELFGVPTKVFNQAIRRNLERFPADFMSQLTEDEHESLRSQIVTSKTVRGGRRYLPCVFTEHGAIMAATILNSPKPDKPEPKKVAVFVGRMSAAPSDIFMSEGAALFRPTTALAAKLLELEHKVSGHDQAIAGLIDAIRQLMMPAAGKSRPIGFTADIETKRK